MKHLSLRTLPLSLVQKMPVMAADANPHDPTCVVFAWRKLLVVFTVGPMPPGKPVGP